MKTEKKKKSRQLIKQNQELKIIEINRPTPEQAKEKINEISREITCLFQNDVRG